MAVSRRVQDVLNYSDIRANWFVRVDDPDKNVRCCSLPMSTQTARQSRRRSRELSSPTTRIKRIG